MIWSPPAVRYFTEWLPQCMNNILYRLYVPTEATVNVKHKSSTANRQREIIWSHFTHGVRQLSEKEEQEEEEEDSG